MNRKQYEQAIIDSQPHLKKRAKKYSRNVSDIEDIVGDAVLILLQRPDWQDIQNVTNFGLGIINFLGLSDIRKSKVRREKEIPIDYVAATLPAPDTDALATMVCREQTEQYIETIRAAMPSAGLSQSECTVIESLLAGLDYTEIAEITGLKRESVATYYSNGICKIRRVLEVK